jgi:peptide/nickel transport system permease protein
LIACVLRQGFGGIVGAINPSLLNSLGETMPHFHVEMRTPRLVFTRLLWIVPVVIGVMTITFFVGRVFSGDPTNLYSPPQADAALRAKIRASLGLDKPLIDQYFMYVKDLLHGNLGTSFTTGRNVGSDLLERMPATLELGLIALALGIVIGIPLGVLAAVNRDKWPDFLIRVFSLGGMALPAFWVGLILLWLFFVSWRILPGPVGRLPVNMPGPPTVTGFLLIDSLLAGDLSLWWQAALQLVLPSLTLGYGALGPIARVTRASMVDALDSEYVRTAVAMGHGRRTIWFRYALRNALLPVVTMIATTVGYLFSGAVLVEAVFGWPGVGAYALQAIQNSDFAALQGFVIYAAVLFVLCYLIVDLLYLAIDPRTRA